VQSRHRTMPLKCGTPAVSPPVIVHVSRHLQSAVLPRRRETGPWLY
jgi:hypothetical protein